MNQFLMSTIVLSIVLSSLGLPGASAASTEVIEVYFPSSYDTRSCQGEVPGTVTWMRVTRYESGDYFLEMTGEEPGSGRVWSLEVYQSGIWSAGAYVSPDSACSRHAEPVSWTTLYYFDCAYAYVEVIVSFGLLGLGREIRAGGGGVCTRQGQAQPEIQENPDGTCTVYIDGDADGQMDPDEALSTAPCSTGSAGEVQVDPAGATILPVTLVGAGTPPVGCAGTVQVTFTNGASLALPGYRLSATGCASPPCDPWSTMPGVQLCVVNPLNCCLTLYGATVGPQDYACLRNTLVRADVNGDGFWDVVVPAATLTSPPC